MCLSSALQIDGNDTASLGQRQVKNLDHQYWFALQVYTLGNNIMSIRNMCNNSGTVVLA